MVKIKNILFFFIFIFFISQCNTNLNRPEETQTFANLDEFFINKSDNENFSGSVLIQKKGVILLRKGYGSADIVSKIPNSPDLALRIGSLTKQFTAMCIMLLVQNDRIKLSDTMDRFFPDYPNLKKISIHHLLSQTAGLTEYLNKVSFRSKNVKIADLLRYFIDEPLQFNPGSRFDYCNSNYILLGYLIELVSGLYYEEFIYKNIIKPLQLQNTGFEYWQYDNTNGNVAKANMGQNTDSDFCTSIVSSTGALYSSVDDLLIWHKALNSEILINKTNLKKMMTPNKNYYGYGFRIRKIKVSDKEYDVAQHGGNIYGFRANIRRFLNEDTVIIILSNNSNRIGKWRDWVTEFIFSRYF